MYERIVVGAAETEAARLAIDGARELAGLMGAEVHLVHAFDPYRDRIDPEDLPATAHAQSFLETLAASFEIPCQIHAVPGDAADAILGVARESDADLIVVGNKGMQGKGRILGSVTNTISHHAPCSVLIVSTT